MHALGLYFSGHGFAPPETTGAESRDPSEPPGAGTGGPVHLELPPRVLELLLESLLVLKQGEGAGLLVGLPEKPGRLRVGALARALRGAVEAAQREEADLELDPGWLITAAKVRGVGVRSRILEANAPFLTLAEAAALLGMSKAGAHDRLAKGRLLGVKVKNGWRLPAWQFVEGALRAGLEPALEALQGETELARLGFFVLPSSLLGERTPKAVLESGDWKAVVAAASGFGTQAAR
jgi:hypothetical protein